MLINLMCVTLSKSIVVSTSDCVYLIDLGQLWNYNYKMRKQFWRKHNIIINFGCTLCPLRIRIR
jgi:hypothetical protein